MAHFQPAPRQLLGQELEYHGALFQFRRLFQGPLFSDPLVEIVRFGLANDRLTFVHLTLAGRVFDLSLFCACKQRTFAEAT